MADTLDLDKIASNAMNDSGSPKYNVPKGIVDAISEIQQFHIFEKEQQKDINKNFFTIGQVFDFVNVGFKSGFMESFIFVTLLPFLQTIYPSYKMYFLGEVFTDDERIFWFLVSFVPMVIITIWLSSLTRLYDGAITKKAILSLLFGRMLAFTMKALVIWLIFGYIYTISTTNPEIIYKTMNWTMSILDFTFYSEKVYQIKDIWEFYYGYIVPALETTAIETAFYMGVFAIIPFVSVVIKGFFIEKNRIRGETEYARY